MAIEETYYCEVGKECKLKKLDNPQPHMISKATCYCEVGKEYKLKKLHNPQPPMISKETCYCEVCVVGTKYLKINSTPSHAWPTAKPTIVRWVQNKKIKKLKPHHAL